jgi:hypothetical protein
MNESNFNGGLLIWKISTGKIELINNRVFQANDTTPSSLSSIFEITNTSKDTTSKLFKAQIEVK